MAEDKRVFRAAAVEQARQIQAQKRIQDRTYDTIIELVDLPSDANADASNPSNSDLQQYRDGIGLLTPDDFDQITLERNIYEKCGHVLCSRKVKKPQKNGTHTIQWAKRGADLSVFPEREVPQWCSPQCEKYCHLVRRQLHHQPAWERQGSLKKIQIPIYTNDLLIHPEHETCANLDSRSQDLAERMKVLSIERGEKQANGKHDDFRLIEKQANGAIVNPPQNNKAHPDSVEGYSPHVDLSKHVARPQDVDGEGDLMDLMYHPL